jgi:hypothetical protein
MRYGLYKSDTAKLFCRTIRIFWLFGRNTRTPPRSACGNFGFSVAARMCAVYMSTMSCCLDRLAALKMVTSRSMFCPEHQTSGIPGVALKIPVISRSMSFSVGNPFSAPCR